MYVSTSFESFRLFQLQPQLFQDYHEGYRKQVKGWPKNPLDEMIQWCEKEIRMKKNQLSIGDFGCGVEMNDGMMHA